MVKTRFRRNAKARAEENERSKRVEKIKQVRSRVNGLRAYVIGTVEVRSELSDLLNPDVGAAHPTGAPSRNLNPLDQSTKMCQFRETTMSTRPNQAHVVNGDRLFAMVARATYRVAIVTFTPSSTSWTRTETATRRGLIVAESEFK
ncbi:hypothetical protein R1sor_001230 [Riccia sorocarpa]|uniref:Uncharacterized protein n=1 Tax=Riccia sorocarpa TaxID=122646 RepID=A0ABD3GVE2_9MARC